MDHPHLVGWWMYVFSLLVIGRSLWYISLGSSWRTSFADLAYSQGEHEHHNSARVELLACSTNRLVHLGIYKRGTHSEISASTQGEYEQLNIYPGKRISWFTLCPWCQRGRVIWCCCYQVQRARLLALRCMSCTWWQPSHRRTSHLHITRWIYRRDIRCDWMYDESTEEILDVIECMPTQRNQMIVLSVTS